MSMYVFPCFLKIFVCGFSKSERGVRQCGFQKEYCPSSFSCGAEVEVSQIILKNFESLNVADVLGHN